VVDCLGVAFQSTAHDLPRLAMAIAKSVPFRRVNAPYQEYLLGGSGPTTPLTYAFQQANSLRSSYEPEGPRLELQAYVEALQVIIEEDGSGGEGGAGGVAGAGR
jgi:hypothetical protein